MHRTLKDDAIRPLPSSTPVEQQRRFDRFRKEFNNERPHESLGMRTPASIYASSSRQYSSKPPEFEYPDHHAVRLVSSNGSIRWSNRLLFLSIVLAGERVGLEEVEPDRWNLSLGKLVLGVFNPTCNQLYPAPYWRE